MLSHTFSLMNFRFFNGFECRIVHFLNKLNIPLLINTFCIFYNCKLSALYQSTVLDGKLLSTGEKSRVAWWFSVPTMEPITGKTEIATISSGSKTLLCSTKLGKIEVTFVLFKSIIFFGFLPINFTSFDRYQFSESMNHYCFTFTL